MPYLCTAACGTLNEQRATVIRALEEAGEPMSPREVAVAVGGDYDATRQRLYQMSLAGELVVVGRGRYAVPNKPNDPNKPLSQNGLPTRDSETHPTDPSINGVGKH